MTAAQRYVKAHPERCKAATDRYRAKNREKIREKQNKHPLRLWHIEQKLKPCFDCNQTFKWWQMQFDHRNPKEKKHGISQMIARHKPLHEIEAEIAKCDLVCANCHANRTHKLFTGGFLQRYES